MKSNPDNDSPLARNSWWLTGVGRLAPGVSDRPSRRGGARTGRRDRAGISRTPTTASPCVLAPVRGINPGDRDKVKPLAALLLGVTLTVLLIACANVANLLVVEGRRAAARDRDPDCTRRQPPAAAQAAAGRKRRARRRGRRLRAAVLTVVHRRSAAVRGDSDRGHADARSAGAAVHVGAEPRDRARVRLDAGAEQPRTSGRRPALKGASGSGRTRAADRGCRAPWSPVSWRCRWCCCSRRRSSSRVWSVARSVDVGFDPRGRVALAFNLKMHRYTPERADAFQRALLDRVRSRAGVHAGDPGHLRAAGRPGLDRRPHPARPPRGSGRRAAAGRVQPRLAAVLRDDAHPDGARTTADRGRHRGAPRTTAVVNQALADRHWPGQDPVGQRFSLEGHARAVPRGRRRRGQHDRGRARRSADGDGLPARRQRRQTTSR